MVEIASAANLGLTGNSLAALKLTANAAGGGRNNERVVVNIANGNLIMQQQDETLMGRGPDLSVLRTYNSQGVSDFDNNDNWRIGFNRQVNSLIGTVNSAGSTVTRVDADGAALTFSWDATLGAYVGKEGEGSYDTLRYDGANWTWTDSDHRVSETYDWDGSSGKLLTQSDPDGNTVIHSYNSAGLLSRVQSASGESTWLDYSGLNLTQVRTTLADGSTSTRVRYGYDAANRLASVTLDLSPGDNSIADGKTYVTTYTYEGSSQCLSTLQQTDGTLLSFGEEVQRVDARNNATTYEYDKDGRLTRITRPVADFYQIKAGSYDASASESQAPVTLYDNSSYGGAVSYFSAGTWDSLAKEISSIKVRSGWKVTMYDDDSGWDGGAQNVTYTTNQSALPSDLNDDVKKVQVSRIAGAEAQVELSLQGATTVAMTYDALGRRLSTANGAGTTANTYDLAGHLIAVTQAGAVTNSSGYDSGGFKFYETNANGDVMSWANDYFGRVTQHGNLDGGSTTYTYDYAGQLTHEVQSGGRDVTTSYNNAGQVTRTVDKVSGTTLRTADYTYDLAGNRLTEKTTIGTTVYQNQSMTYDAIGRLTQGGDATNYVTYKYDLLGNRAKQTSVAAGVTTNAFYAYDAMNRMTLADGVLNNAVQDSGNLTGAAGRRISYDLNGNRTSETAFNYTQGYSYDALNRLVTTTHNGATLRYTKYDLADRVLESFDQSQASQTEAVHYTNIYDSAGRLVRQFHRAGSNISGNVITTGSDDSATFNTYDALGKWIPAALTNSGSAPPQSVAWQPPSPCTRTTSAQRRIPLPSRSAR